MDRDRRYRYGVDYVRWRQKHKPPADRSERQHFDAWCRRHAATLKQVEVDAVWAEVRSTVVEGDEAHVGVDPGAPEGSQTVLWSPEPATGRQARARARSTDPGTSHAAAASLSGDVIRESQRQVFELFLLHGPMHDQKLLEVAAEAGVRQSPSGLRTRRRELVDAKKLCDSNERATLSSGRKSIIWEVR